MSNSERPAESSAPRTAPEEQEAGVFASLPRSRPSVRSPRRSDTARTAQQAPAPQQDADRAGGGPEQELEALARASISLVGGAASLGLRAAGRAAAALRDAVERR